MIEEKTPEEIDSKNEQLKKLPPQDASNKKDTKVLVSGVSEEEIENHNRHERGKTTKKRLIRIGILAAAVLIVLFVYWYRQRPITVTIIHPTQTILTETITSSGRVGGITETNVGSQSPGIVQKLYVEEGAEVVRGQQIALIKNDVAAAQVLQAQAALNTARSQLVQVSRGSLTSDIDAATEQVRQTQAVVEQQNAQIGVFRPNPRKVSIRDLKFW